MPQRARRRPLIALANAMPVSIVRIAARVLRASRATTTPISRVRLRVRPADVDLNLHMNYAAYLEAMELARWDWFVRSGLASDFWRERLRPVVASLQIDYRKELAPLARYVVDTRLVGYDRRAIVMKQRFFVGDTLHAEATLSILILRASRPIPSDEVATLTAKALVASY